jgi:large subunit ribosomal protein L15
MNLSSLRPPAGSTKKRKRVGRGPGSGHGKTSGRGEKGQKSRTGYSRRPGFEGGQMPLVRRVPKRGFTNLFRKEFALVNLERLEGLEGNDFTPATLLEGGVVSNLRDGLKILAEGEITRAITVSAHKISKSAQQKIEAAGGKVTLIEEPVRRIRKVVEPKPAANPEPVAKKAAPKKAAPKKVAPKKVAPKKVAPKKPAVKKAAKKATKKGA